MIEDYESYKLALLLQQICKESESDYAVQWQTLIQVQRSFNMHMQLGFW